MIPCVIESPFKGANKAEESRNKAYLNKCIRWCILNGYTPYASHKMLTEALDDDDPAEREQGILTGLAAADVFLEDSISGVVFFFQDYGLSEGMKRYAEPHHESRGRTILYREIGKL